MKAALDGNDSLITAYRCHGWAYVWGWSPKAILAELFGEQILIKSYERSI
jgi:pyruvate dehydrogenase E1 component alpha subunit